MSLCSPLGYSLLEETAHVPAPTGGAATGTCAWLTCLAPSSAIPGSRTSTPRPARRGSGPASCQALQREFASNIFTLAVTGIGMICPPLAVTCRLAISSPT